jgi:NhaP-type Na+/H+ or K+/H+ antiporter
MVVAVGVLLTTISAVPPGLLLAGAVFLVIRPAAALVALTGSSLSRGERAYIGWFGVRGVGSLYYLAFALTHGLAGPEGRHLADATLVVVATSILVHGISVTPLMRRYSRRHA